MRLPKDPMMLLSVVNTKLRDEYESLEELCSSLDAAEEEITAPLAAAGFHYEAALNRFC